MGTLTKNDLELLQEKVKYVDHGIVTLEIKQGECVAITHEGREFTDKGKDLFKKKHSPSNRNR